MENYEILEVIGEGTYGHVYKARHKPSNLVVAIKKFKDSESEDEHVNKTALREINALNSLNHSNIVNLLETFRHEGKICLVFEYVDHTVLQDIDITPQGLPPERVKKLMYQMLRAVAYMHENNLIHRDIKPENLLISKNGILKLWDFGFAREIIIPHHPNILLTDYVSTRWYRAPELLVGDAGYSKAVDIWSIGCIFAEIYNGNPLFPGESDIDTLYHILKALGNDLTDKQKKSFKKNPLYSVRLPKAQKLKSLEQLVPEMGSVEIDLLK